MLYTTAARTTVHDIIDTDDAELQRSVSQHVLSDFTPRILSSNSVHPSTQSGVVWAAWSNWLSTVFWKIAWQKLSLSQSI